MLLLARYVLPVSTPHIEDGAVLVRDNEIIAVGTRSDLLREHPDEEVVDYGLAALMPGFIDLHTHLEYATFRGVVDDLPYTRWKMEVQGREDLLSEEDWADSAVLGAIETIRSGITTVADLTDTGASVAAVQDSGLRGVDVSRGRSRERSPRRSPTSMIGCAVPTRRGLRSASPRIHRTPVTPGCIRLSPKRSAPPTGPWQYISRDPKMSTTS